MFDTCSNCGRMKDPVEIKGGPNPYCHCCSGCRARDEALTIAEARIEMLQTLLGIEHDPEGACPGPPECVVCREIMRGA